MAADGGYASIENLHEAKKRQVTDVVFHKKRGLKVDEMAKSLWVYRKLRNFRAGIEAGISCLKRAYGLGRCSWKGLSHFKAYVWSSVVAHKPCSIGVIEVKIWQSIRYQSENYAIYGWTLITEHFFLC